MIHFADLDKNQTYIGLQYGISRIAQKIVKYTKQYAPDSSDIPTHVFAIVYRHDLGDWWIYESHLKENKKMGFPSGVRRYSAKKWLRAEIASLHQFEAYPFNFDRYCLEDFVGFRYGTGSIAALMLAAIKNKNGKQKDREGYICSEYLACCNPNVCTYFELPPWCITPAHYQHYLQKHNEAVY
ncbi:MAG: hypothetical protein IJ681_00195 [Bacteroidales bacterium]|nr:hypothetical protein [Bacteroidales bacterium]